MTNFENMTLIELKNIAKEKNIKNISKLKKEELITMLNDLEKNTLNKTKELRYDSDDKDQLEEFNEVEDSSVEYKVTNNEDKIIRILFKTDTTFFIYFFFLTSILIFTLLYINLYTKGIKEKVKLPNIDINLDILSCLKTKKEDIAVNGNIKK